MRSQLTSKRILVLGVAFAVTLVFGQNCSKLEVSPNISLGGSDVATGAQSAEPVPSIAFMSAEQSLKAMISATSTEGLGELTDPADDMINSTYNLRNGSLPSVNSLDQATGPTMISVANIASSVCAKAVDRDRGTGEAQAADRIFFRELDFSKGLSAQSSEGVTLAFARLARNAWRRDVEQNEVDGVLSFAQTFSAGTDAADPVQTRNLALSICTAVLSSLDALTY